MGRFALGKGLVISELGLVPCCIPGHGLDGLRAFLRRFGRFSSRD